jgi:hypothetical protein
MAFTTIFSLNTWHVLLFGLDNASSQFLQIVNSIMEPINCKFIIGYLDEIIIISHILVENILHVKEMITLLMEHGSDAKCAQFTRAYQTVGFCSFEIERDSIHTKERKIHMVMDWPQQ